MEPHNKKKINMYVFLIATIGIVLLVVQHLKHKRKVDELNDIVEFQKTKVGRLNNLIQEEEVAYDKMAQNLDKMAQNLLECQKAGKSAAVRHANAIKKLKEEMHKAKAELAEPTEAKEEVKPAPKRRRSRKKKTE